MCGIAASYGEIEGEAAQNMLERLSHRGPVGEGDTRVASNWIGNRRCAIADAQAGEQPIVNEAGDVFMVADAAIYNHEELDTSLNDGNAGEGTTIQMVLRLIDERGPRALAELNGMFAIIIAGNEGRFVAARDPVGIKPLYWARRDGQVLFASELAAFDEAWRPDVEFFPPGHYWSPESGLVRFADAVPSSPDRFDHSMDPGADIPEEILTSVRDELVRAVNLQLPNEAEIGVFLSGGLDSSIIAAIAAPIYRQRGKKLKTFAVGLDHAPDLLAARAVAEYLGTEHYETTYTASDALHVLPDVVRSLENFDPSLVRSSVANYLVARFAASHFKVVLTGEGSDEIFAGYEYFEDFETEEELRRELIHGLEEGHYVGLQRLDRMPMSHGVEARVPFLDRNVIEQGFAIPAGWKFVGKGQPEKRLLREAFVGWLPDEFLWRKKAQFGEGSGAEDVLKQKVEQSVSEVEFARERNAIEPPLRTREELAYYRIFAQHLPGIRPEQTIGRFVTP